MRYADVKCFWIEPTGLQKISAAWWANGPCPSHEGGEHRDRVLFAEQRVVMRDGEWRREDDREALTGWNPPAEQRFCACGFPFTSAPSLGTSMQYRRTDTGQLFDRVNDAGPGAMWDATWYRDMVGGNYLPHMPADGRIICVTLPNGRDWAIDSRCSNCTLPDDKVHACWVRTGEPPNLTVGKNGVTCAAGAGSIFSGDYHGFLRNGVLTTA